MSEQTRALVKLALTEPTPPESIGIHEIQAALGDLANQPPLKNLEPGLDGQLSRLIEDTLRPIGAALDPRMAAEPAKVWRKAMLLKLSDLPGPVAIKAARKALHTPFQFFNEVEGDIRRKASEVLMQQRVATHRLNRWLAEFERLANAPPALAAPLPAPLTQAEIDAMNRMMRSIRSKQRWRLEDGEAVGLELDQPEEPEEPQS